jgi:ribosome-interacting GTPase 1
MDEFSCLQSIQSYVQGYITYDDIIDSIINYEMTHFTFFYVQKVHKVDRYKVTNMKVFLYCNNYIDISCKSLWLTSLVVKL